MFGRRGVSPLLALALVSACNLSQSSGPSTVYGSRVHVAPKHPSSSAGQSATTPNANLQYYGGRVIEHVKVVAIAWGPNVNADVTKQIGGFFTAVTNSRYMDWLSEYNTSINAVSGSAGTNQSIGRGSFGGLYTITPGNTATSLANEDVQAELAAQIGNGAVPAPDANTLYFIYFPPGISISLQGSQSCANGGFCGYHSTFTSASNEVYFAVIPDFSAGSGCDTGCGNGALFDNVSATSSHELIEAVTDAEIGIATGGLGAPMAWYDSTNGEIGDICNQYTDPLVAPNGTTYTVQREWSNVQHDCISSRSAMPPANPSDFSLALSPSSQSVAQGTSAGFTVQTAVASGAAEAITLSVSGLPNGFTSSFDNASISSGQTATLTIAANASLMPGTYPFTLTGSATTGQHTAAGAITLTAPTMSAPMCTAAQNACIGATLSTCNTSTGTMQMTQCTDAACAASGQGASMGCGMDANGNPACLCQPCPNGQSLCGSTCVDVTSDPNNCGGCAQACGTGNSCSNGMCSTTCTPTQNTCLGNTLTYCDTNTGTLQTATCSDDSCAAAGYGPLAGCQQDSSGYFQCICQPCAAGLTQCSRTCTDMTSDPNNCGACGTACPSGTCAGGVCQ